MRMIRLGKLEIDLEELRDFIVEGKKNCYAGNGKEIILPDGSKLLTFQKGNFYYEDNYAYYYQAPGRELVKWQDENGQRIFQMAYSGGMLNKDGVADLSKDEQRAKKTFDFLKKTLLNVPREIPFRGPMLFSDNDFRYFSHITCSDNRNNLIRFSGNEGIVRLENQALEFSQDFHGCLCIPK